MVKSNVVLMAIASGTESKEGVVFPKYTGVEEFTLLKINPTKNELVAMYKAEGRDVNIEEEPKYFGVNEDGINTARVDFYFKAVNNDMIVKVVYFLNNKLRVNKDDTKVQAINIYGETIWMPKENFLAKSLPENQQWFDIEGLRQAYEGEEVLTSLVKAFLSIPNKSFKKKDGTIKWLDNKQEAWCSLDKIPSYFRGDFTEIKGAFGSRPTNKIKFCLCVNTTEDNKQYQNVFKEMPMKLNVTDYSKLDLAIKNAKDNSGYPTTNFGAMPYNFQEYSDQPTALNAIASSESALPDGWGL